MVLAVQLLRPRISPPHVRIIIFYVCYDFSLCIYQGHGLACDRYCPYKSNFISKFLQLLYIYIFHHAQHAIDIGYVGSMREIVW